jgi:hypothetical protein
MARTVTQRGLVLDKRKWESASVKAGILAGALYPHDTITPANGDKPYPDPRGGKPVAMIAAALNYGSGKQRIARPFMEQTIAAKKEAWTRGLTVMLHSGSSVQDALDTAGQAMRDAIRETIDTWPGDNDDKWAEIKGFNHGLVFHSTLMNSIEYEVDTGE